MLSFTDIIIYGVYAILVAALLYLTSIYKNNEELGSENAKRNRVICAILIIAIVVIFSAFRLITENEGGTDAFVYREQFLNSNVPFFQQFVNLSGFEPLHVLSLWLVRAFTDNYTVYLVLYYIILALLLIKIAGMYEWHKGGFLSLFAIVLFSVTSFNTQRNTFAVFFSFLIVDQLRKGRYRKAVLLGIITTLIHFSAAIYFIVILGFYYLKYVKGDYNRKLGVFVCLSLAAAAFISVLVPFVTSGTRLSNYSVEFSFSLPMFVLFVFLAAFPFFVYLNYAKDPDFTTLWTILVLFSPMFVFQMFYAIMYRMMLYCVPVMYTMIWKYKNLIIKDPKDSTVFFYCLLNIALIVRILTNIVGGNSDIGSYTNVLFM